MNTETNHTTLLFRDLYFRVEIETRIRVDLSLPLICKSHLRVQPFPDDTAWSTPHGHKVSMIFPTEFRAIISVTLC